MERLGDRRATNSSLHDNMVLAMASCRLHKRLHDPDHVLAEAAVDEMIESLAAAGFIVTNLAVTLAGAGLTSPRTAIATLIEPVEQAVAAAG